MMPNVISLPRETIFHHLPCVEFLPGFPNIRGLEMMPPETLQIMLERWCTPVPARPITCHSLREVYAVQEGLVFDKDLNLYVESITQHEPALIEASFERLKAAIDDGAVPYQPGTMLLCGKSGMSNYGHWMLEMLPMAHVCRHWIGPGWGVFLPVVYSWMASAVMESLELLGVPAEICIQNDSRPFAFNELVFVNGLSAVGQFYRPAAVECMDAISAAVPMGGYSDHVWVSRLDSLGARRALVDESAVCEALQARGWHIMQAAEMSIRDQISVCKGARYIAGVAGAGMTNLGFLAPGGRTTIFMPCDMPDIFFLHLATHRGLSYREVRCLTEPVHGTAGHIRLRLNVPDLLAHLG